MFIWMSKKGPPIQFTLEPMAAKSGPENIVLLSSSITMNINHD